MSLEFGLLGSVEVRAGDRVLQLGAAKPRALLALLLLRANELVSRDDLVLGLWGEASPPRAANAVQVYVSQLRKLLPDGARMLVTRPPGYVLRVEPNQLDLDRFERLAAEGRRALADGAPAAAAATLREALALWRGEALADIGDEPFAASERRRLDELRLVALEDRIDADLAAGRDAELVPELSALVEQEPYRERLRRQLMLALYRGGRQSAALSEYRRLRRTLVDELALEPSPELQRVEAAILAHDPALDAEPEQAAEAYVPASPTPLVGRERELADARELLLRADVRLVTLTGPGGIGKTRLAIAVAEAVRAEFADGVFFVALETLRQAALVTSSIATALGVVGGGGSSAGEGVERHLRNRSVLLVLDNFEQLLPAAPTLALLLAEAPRLKLLVTSRAVLRVAGEHELPVPPLRLPGEADTVDDYAFRRVPALALFAERARAVRPDFEVTEANARTVAEICARLDGLPLAIELAAAWVKLLDLRAILERLGSRLDLLTGGARDKPQRQQTLRAAIEWSYELLGPDERRLFTHASVFVGGFGLDAAAAVTRIPERELLDRLRSLVDQSLVTAATAGHDGGLRFLVLETIREYALGRLAAARDADEVRTRHAAYYLGLAEAAERALHGTDQADWLRRLEQERGNLRAAFELALERGDAETALRLAGALWRFWQLRGHLVEGRLALERALAAGADAPAAVRARCRNGAGVLAGEQGDFAAARSFFEESLTLAREAGDSDRVASALSNLGILALYQADYDRAESLYRESRDLWAATGNRANIAAALENLGCIALCRYQLDEAVDLLEASVALARETAHPHNLGSSLRALVRALLLRGEAPRAAALLVESLEIARSLHEPHAIAECLEAFGGLAAVEGDGERAGRLFGAAEAQRESIGALRQPDQRPWFERMLAEATALVDESSFAAAFEDGRLLSLDTALALLASRISIANRKN
jgi:predicted ATPase/DNA-binding SARP family transcriptional activator